MAKDLTPEELPDDYPKQDVKPIRDAFRDQLNKRRIFTKPK
mgnify:CR=1 FL=1